MPDPRFKHGDRVRAAREGKLVMEVTDVDGRLPAERPAMYRCQPLGNANAHGRGTSARWFREDDLVPA